MSGLSSTGCPPAAAAWRARSSVAPLAGSEPPRRRSERRLRRPPPTAACPYGGERGLVDDDLAASDDLVATVEALGDRGLHTGTARRARAGSACSPSWPRRASSSSRPEASRRAAGTPRVARRQVGDRLRSAKSDAISGRARRRPRVRPASKQARAPSALRGRHRVAADRAVSGRSERSDRSVATPQAATAGAPAGHSSLVPQSRSARRRARGPRRSAAPSCPPQTGQAPRGARRGPPRRRRSARRASRLPRASRPAAARRCGSRRAAASRASRRGDCDRCVEGEVESGGHGTLRNRPTTRPRTRTSCERIGSIVAFSGCRRTWSASRKKRLTVASSPDERDDDLAVGRGLLRAHDDVVALEDAGVDHRLAAHAQDVLARRRRRRRRAPRRTPRCSPRRGSAGRRRPGRRAAGPPRAASASHAVDDAAPTARSSSSIARGFVGSRRSSPSFSRFARCACTVDDEARPTALPMSRTVGG